MEERSFVTKRGLSAEVGALLSNLELRSSFVQVEIRKVLEYLV